MKFVNTNSVLMIVYNFNKEDLFILRCVICEKKFGKKQFLIVHLFKTYEVGSGSNLKNK